MKFITDILSQKCKSGYSVCGDYRICSRTEAGTVYILCDGIGSGVYANIAAITCAERLKELFLNGISLRAAAEMVAASMHRARKEDIPFSAFSAVLILPGGHFTVYTYEAPEPILLQKSRASIMTRRFYTAGFEVISESAGYLQLNDSLLLFSDGVTQAGLGHGYGMGVGAEGIAEYINRVIRNNSSAALLPENITSYCRSVSGNRYEDDTTLALLHCREAKELTFLTGPPSKPSMDREYASLIQKSQGKKVVCGSTTIDILSRELDIRVETVNLRANAGGPPEYGIAGIDIATEGAIMLNQVCNIIDEPAEILMGCSAVERLCEMLREADVIHFHIGNALNEAHDRLFFKQLGMQVRRTTVEMLADKLQAMGKVVIKKYY